MTSWTALSVALLCLPGEILSLNATRRHIPVSLSTNAGEIRRLRRRESSAFGATFEINDVNKLEDVSNEYSKRRHRRLSQTMGYNAAAERSGVLSDQQIVSPAGHKVLQNDRRYHEARLNSSNGEQVLPTLHRMTRKRKGVRQKAKKHRSKESVRLKQHKKEASKRRFRAQFHKTRIFPDSNQISYRYKVVSENKRSRDYGSFRKFAHDIAMHDAIPSFLLLHSYRYSSDKDQPGKFGESDKMKDDPRSSADSNETHETGNARQHGTQRKSDGTDKQVKSVKKPGKRHKPGTANGETEKIDIANRNHDTANDENLKTGESAKEAAKPAYETVTQNKWHKTDTANHKAGEAAESNGKAVGTAKETDKQEKQGKSGGTNATHNPQKEKNMRQKNETANASGILRDHAPTFIGCKNMSSRGIPHHNATRINLHFEYSVESTVRNPIKIVKTLEYIMMKAVAHKLLDCIDIVALDSSPVDTIKGKCKPVISPVDECAQVIGEMGIYVKSGKSSTEIMANAFKALRNVVDSDKFVRDVGIQELKRVNITLPAEKVYTGEKTKKEEESRSKNGWDSNQGALAIKNDHSPKNVQKNQKGAAVYQSRGNEHESPQNHASAFTEVGTNAGDKTYHSRGALASGICAALALGIAILLFLVHRRRNDTDPTIKNARSEILDDGSADVTKSDMNSITEDFASFRGQLAFPISTQDVHRCASALCVECRRENAITFLSAKR